MTGWPASLVNPLPVEIGLLEAVFQNDKSILLMWHTVSEKNNSRFEIERSFQGTEFETIGDVSGNGTTYERVDYTFSDRTPSLPTYGCVYYRLKQIDYDETTAYSQVVAAYNDNIQTADSEVNAGNLILNVFPNPLQGTQLHISLRKPTAGRLSIIKSDGQPLLSQELEDIRSEHNLELMQNADPGVYILTLESAYGRSSKKLIKR